MGRLFLFIKESDDDLECETKSRLAELDSRLRRGLTREIFQEALSSFDAIFLRLKSRRNQMSHELADDEGCTIASVGSSTG